MEFEGIDRGADRRNDRLKFRATGGAPHGPSV
jgi:hypothetical protein